MSKTPFLLVLGFLMFWCAYPLGHLEMEIESTTDNNMSKDSVDSFQGCTGPLFGSYTIGGATADYASISAAIFDLKICGISGPVVFDVNVGSGPFDEQLTLQEITGASSMNTITFNGNGETLTAATTTTSRSLFLLDGADYITITNFNLVTQAPEFNFVIQLMNDANFNTISGNTIDLSSTLLSSGSTNAGIVMSGSTSDATMEGDNGDYLTVTNNTIIGGYYGIIINGKSSTIHSTNNIISENNIQDFDEYGIYLSATSDGIVSKNNIHRTNRLSVGGMQGIYYFNGGGNNITDSNIIHDSHTANPSASGTVYGIYHNDTSGTATDPNIVSNNLIYNINGASGIIYGLNNRRSDNVKYYYNTIVLDHQAALSGNTRGYNQGNKAGSGEFYNNIFYITRGGNGVKEAMYYTTNATPFISDHNIFYVNSSEGTTRIGWNKTALFTLSNWKTATGGDANSLDLDPVFIAPTSGNLNPTNPAVDNMGLSLGAISIDITGATRNVLTPDIGAYEFTAPTCFQPRNISYTTRTGSTAGFTWDNPLTVPTNGYEWVVMALGSTPNPATSISTGSSATNIAMASGLSARTDYEFYVRSNCGAGDLSQWEGPFEFTSGCITPLAGTYTIGGPTADYATLSAAVFDLKNCGVSNAVEFNVTVGSGPFEEGQLIIEEVYGASATNTITFNGNGETFKSLGTINERSSFLLDGADYITINNFNLTTDNSDCFVIFLTNDANYNNITNNTIDLSVSMLSSSNSSAGIVMSASRNQAVFAGNNGGHLTISNNTIIGGYFGIIINGKSETEHSMNNIITGNTIQDFHYYGVFMNATSNGTISNNDIHRTNRTLNSFVAGIYYETAGENNITNANKIHDFFTSRPEATGFAYGIYHNGVVPSSGSYNIVSNNSIYNLNGATGTHYGLYNNNSSNLKYYYNSISLDHPDALRGTTRGYFQNGLSPNTEFKNNIISITRGGNGVNHAIYFQTPAANVVSDNNVFYVNAANGTNYIAYRGGNHTTLANWMVASSGDYNSLDVNPLYINPYTGNLSPANSVVDNKGTPISGITTDINGVTRSTTMPDIGAYEFTPPSCMPPSGHVANNITDTTADVSWTENGTAIQWEIEYGLKGFTPGTGSTVIDNDGVLGITLTGLTENTEYDFYVRAVCSPTDKSALTGIGSFRTDCAPETTPYYLTFEVGEECVSIESLSSTWEILTGNAQSFTGTWARHKMSAGKAADAWLYTNGVALTAGKTYTISYLFDGNLFNEEKMKVAYGTSNSATAMTNILANHTTLVPSTPTTNSVNFVAPTSDVYYFGFHAYSVVGSRYIYLDDISIVEVINCPAPSDIAISNITHRAARVSWTENGTATAWQIEYGLSGFNQGSGTMGVSTSGILNIANLTDGATYDVYVRSICGINDESYWEGPETFTTLPAPCAIPSGITVNNITNDSAVISWTENGNATQWEIEYGITGYTPGNGLLIQDNDGALGETLIGLFGATTYDVYVRAVCTAASSSNWGGPFTFTTLVNPCIEPSAITANNVTPNSADISWTENGIATAWEIEYGISGFSRGSGIFISDSDGTPGETLTGLSDLTSYDIYVRSVCNPTNVSDWIGPFSFTTLVTPCVDPSSIIATNVTHNSSAISWTENGTATVWDIEYGVAGFTQGNGTVISDTDGTLGETITGLSELTSYHVYVRAVCSATNMSNWVGPISFTTLVTPCIIPSAITASNITHNSADISWTENGTATMWNIEYGISGFTQGSGALIQDTDGILGETLTGLLEFTAYDVYVRAVCSQTNISAWAGPITFTTPIKPCAVPTAIMASNVTNESADITWTENGTATNWEIEYGVTGFTQGNGTLINDTDGTLGETITGLSELTSYDVYVRAICSVTNMSAWAGPISFKTLEIPCADPSDITISNITESTAEVVWTENGTATEWEVEYGIAGFTLGTGMVISDNDGALGEVLVGLTNSTSYDVYVRAICSSSNASKWIGPESFSTKSLGITNLDFANFNYYPNPVTSELELVSSLELKHIVLYNLLGQKVIEATPRGLTTTLNLDGLSSGAYLLKVEINNSTEVFRIIKN